MSNGETPAPPGTTSDCADPESACVQLLNPEGELVEHPEYTVEFTDDEYRGLYRDLVVIRKIDAEGTALQRQGEMALWAGLLGQEASQVGTARALRPQDMVFPTYREHGLVYCRGLDLITPFSLFRGVDFGPMDPREANFHMYTLSIGAQTLHATGYALGVAMDGKVGGDDGEAVLVYYGDGASSQGDVHEAFVWAGSFNPPIVFFCQNNQYAISVPLERQSRVPLYRRAAGYGFPGLRVDGNDVLAVYAVTRRALDEARRGEGPRLIEAYTYRMGPHTSSDDPTRYRTASEVEAWRAKDPITRLRRFLERQHLADEDFFADVDAQATRESTELRERVLALPDPGLDALFDHVYADGSPLLDSERARFVGTLAPVEGGGY